MLLLRTKSLPEGAKWLLELKLDGYRALAIKTRGKVDLRSRNNNDFNGRYPSVVKVLAAMPDETVIDGELVSFDESGRPSFNVLQNYGSSRAPVFYYVFDLLILTGRNVMNETMETRRDLLERKVLPKLGEPIRYSPELKGALPDLVSSIKVQGPFQVAARPFLVQIAHRTCRNDRKRPRSLYLVSFTQGSIYELSKRSGNLFETSSPRWDNRTR